MDKHESESNPVLEANVFSKLLYWWVHLRLPVNIYSDYNWEFLKFSWITPLLSRGYKAPLMNQDLFNLIPAEEAKNLTDELEKYVFSY